MSGKRENCVTFSLPKAIARTVSRDLFSKSVLDVRTRLVVTVESETKWTPNSNSASKLMPKCKILG